MSVLSAPYMHDEAAAFAHVEAMLWPQGPVCLHCGVVDRAYRLQGVRTKATAKNPEGRERHGLWKCRECRKQFTVRKGTIFEESHIDLHLWLQAIHLMVSSKKGISSHQMHRVLGITYKSAWFLTNRIRECMRDGDLAPFGGNGGAVEVDETFIGKEPGVTKAKNARGGSHKMKVLTLVDRETKRARSIVVDDLTKATLLPILRENISREAFILTDEAPQYNGLATSPDFSGHDWVNHSKDEYVRREAIFDFRYNHRIANGVDDAERGAFVRTTCILPSGSLLSVSVQPAIDGWIVSDEGSAAWEASSSGRDVDDALAGLRSILAQKGLNLQNGKIYSPGVSSGELPYMVAYLATAALDASRWLTSKAAKAKSETIVDALPRHLRMKFPDFVMPEPLSLLGDTDKAYTFRNVLLLPDRRRLILDPVLRQDSAIKSRIVANIDVARQARKPCSAHRLRRCR